MVQPGAFAQWLPFTLKRSTKATCPYTHLSLHPPIPHPPCCPGAAGRSRCTQCWLQRGARGETLKLSLGKEHHRGHCHETKASWEHQPCATAGSTRSHPAPSKAQGFPQFQDCHLPWDNQRSQRWAGGVQGHLEAGSPSPGLQHHHRAQQDSPTKRTSRSDFTGLVLNVFSTGHSFSWLQVQTLDMLPSCKTNPQGTFQTTWHIRHCLGQAQQGMQGCFPGFLSHCSHHCCICCLFSKMPPAKHSCVRAAGPDPPSEMKRPQSSADATTHPVPALLSDMTSAPEGP